MGKPVADILGRRFSKLVVIERLGSKNGKSNWLCKCDCGEVTESIASNLLNGSIKSCGCFRREVLATSKLSHGKSGTRTHNIWRDMLKRCKTHPRYAGRGIKVCDRWLTFENFLSDMGDPPTSRHSIERKNNDGNYEPGNCAWIHISKQSLNTSRTRRITIDGETKPLSEWCRQYNKRYGLVLDRIDKLNWPIMKALTENTHA